MTIGKAIARAWKDSAYRSKLLSDPHAALTEVGVDVPVGVTVRVLENTKDVRHVVLPVAPEDAGELSAEALEAVAGGGSLDPYLGPSGSGSDGSGSGGSSTVVS